MDLSILIPARNEEFVGRTVRNVLRNIKGKTEIIVVLDGKPANPPLPAHPSVLEVQLNKSIGQRAATNLAARISRAKYVMKLDAHCAVGPAFDTIMIDAMQDEYTMVPTMYNLHAFDWVCKCGYRRYQGPTAPCDSCGAEMTREIIWAPKKSPETTAMGFGPDLRFMYWSKYKKHQTGDLVDTMSILGACWMLTRDRYFELDICDEAHGGWGQQGTEVACKTWLSGGRLVCNRRTWFAHMFRTQGGDFGFPYSISASDVNKARDHSKHLFIDGNWPGAKHKLEWLVSKFAPVPGWTAGLDAPSKGIVYYTDSQLDSTISTACQVQLDQARNGHELITVSLQPTLFGENIVLDEERGILTMFKQILAGLEASTADVVYLCEHDVLYHASHFEFNPPARNVFYYNQNRWQVDAKSGRALFRYANSTSGLCAYRELLLEHYRKRVELVERDGYSYRMGFEPGTHGRTERVDDYKHKSYMSSSPNIDLRHGGNLTRTRWDRAQWRNKRYTRGWEEGDGVPDWGMTRERMGEFLDGLYSEYYQRDLEETA